MADVNQDPYESLEWRWKPFADLTAGEAYDMLEARNAVFIVEQRCVYNDVDGLDRDAWHLFAYSRGDAAGTAQDGAKGPKLAGYLRVLLPDATDPDARIGRVLTTSAFRRIGLGSAMLAQALKHIVAQWPEVAIKLHAQAHLQMFYGAFGFEPISEVHDDDGIPHIWMRSV
jgi:ElaA protein